jgi:hypothetical protein
LEVAARPRRRREPQRVQEVEGAPLPDGEPAPPPPEHARAAGCCNLPGSLNSGSCCFAVDQNGDLRQHATTKLSVIQKA